MRKELINRVIQISDYIIETKDTIRKTALVFKISKSTVHKDIQERLKEIDYDKYKVIESIFKNHIDNRHILGGQSTKRKYEKLRLNNEG